MPQLPRVTGAHLVGSINQPTAAETFRVVADELGGDLARVPDGEVGERFHWILFQGARFEAVDGLSRLPIDPILVAGFDVRPLTIDGTVPASKLRFGALGYADAAIAGYAEFAALRDAGVIPAGTRFQVCLPTPLAPVTTFVAASDRAAVYPAYAEALAAELARIAAAIPAGELAVQIDLATEFAYLEGVSLGGGALEPFFVAPGDRDDRDAMAGAAARLAAELANRVPVDAELGFHLCYGDVAERHFVEPADAALLVTTANALGRAVSRRIDWVHLPVPIERSDAAYFAPLEAWRVEAKPYLGLVHHEDGVEGALARLATARTALAAAGVAELGVGTECGFGRGPAERTAPLLALHREVIAAAG